MLLAVDKPAGLLSQGDISRSENLLDLLKGYLKERYGKPGNVFLGLVHRLDRNTSGVICFAKNSKSASRLSGQFRTNTVARIYHVVVEGHPARRRGSLTDRLGKDEDENIVTAEENGKEATLHYSVLKQGPGAALLEVRIDTGRPHQIRFQLGRAGMPVLGDKKYGVASQHIGRPAVHAASLTLTHPVSQERIVLAAPHPADIQDLIRKAVG
ncbi:MAG TPA: RNA pseudouridine synthase [bacterium]|nr:RNA pseudouridine synthase [bacterium]